MRNVFVALGEGDRNGWTLWGYFMRNPVAFVRKEPCLPFTLNGFFLWKIGFCMSASEGFSSVLFVCVLRVSSPWLPLALSLAFRISRTFS